jgi:hypothetical protein
MCANDLILAVIYFQWLSFSVLGVLEMFLVFFAFLGVFLMITRLSSCIGCMLDPI